MHNIILHYPNNKLFVLFSISDIQHNILIHKKRLIEYPTNNYKL